MAAKLPGIGTLKDLNRILGDITGKLDRLTTKAIDKAFDVDPRPLNDVERKLDAINMVSERWAKGLKKIYEYEKKLRDELKEELKQREKIEKQLEYLEEIEKKRGKLHKDEEEWHRHLSKLYNQHDDKVKSIDKKLKEMPKKWEVTKLVIGSLLHVVKEVGLAVGEIGFAALGAVFAGLENGIKTTYELFERWTKAMGAFNMHVGSLSPNMQGFTREAKRWEGVVRGLTDQFGLGLEMATEFADGFERILPEDEEKRWGKLGLQVSRGLGLGAEQAGEFEKSMYQLDQSADQTVDTFGDIIVGAQKANLSTNKWAKEIVASKNFVVSFGKAAQKSFLTGAAWAKSLGVSLKSLESLTNLTDTFEGAAQAAAKMNTVFGTSIDSLDLMMEDDPSRRLEMIRKQFQAQGKTIENLSRQEKKFLSQTLELSMDELDGVLKSGKSLEEFQKDAAKEKQDAVKTERQLQQAMLRTAQTMFAFGAAWDRITFKIANMLKPFTEAIGLTQKGKDSFSGLGDVAGRVFDDLGKMIDRVAKNENFKQFLSMLGKDLVKAFEKIEHFVQTTDFDQLISSLSEGIGNFWTEINKGLDYVLKHLPEASKMIGTLAEALGSIAKSLELITWPLRKIFEATAAVQGIFSEKGEMEKAWDLHMDLSKKLAEAQAQKARELQLAAPGAAIEELTGGAVTAQSVGPAPSRYDASDLAPVETRPNLAKRRAPAAEAPVAGDVYLDGEKVGKHIAKHVAKQIAREAGEMPGTM